MMSGYIDYPQEVIEERNGLRKKNKELQAALSDISLWVTEIPGYIDLGDLDEVQFLLAKIFDRADVILREGE